MLSARDANRRKKWHKIDPPVSIREHKACQTLRGGIFAAKECETGIIKNTNSPQATAENGRKSQNFGQISEFPGWKSPK